MKSKILNAIMFVSIIITICSIIFIVLINWNPKNTLIFLSAINNGKIVINEMQVEIIKYNEWYGVNNSGNSEYILYKKLSNNENTQKSIINSLVKIKKSIDKSRGDILLSTIEQCNVLLIKINYSNTYFNRIRKELLLTCELSKTLVLYYNTNANLILFTDLNIEATGNEIKMYLMDDQLKNDVSFLISNIN